MEQIEIISWKTLEVLKESATKIIEIIGDLDTHEHMSVFCHIDDDYLELYYSELDINYIRHFEDEEEFFKFLGDRKKEFGEEDFDSMEYYEDDNNFDNENSEENYDGYNIKDEDEEDEL